MGEKIVGYTKDKVWMPELEIGFPLLILSLIYFLAGLYNYGNNLSAAILYLTSCAFLAFSLCFVFNTEHVPVLKTIPKSD